jgi:SAM-dependent methyltransferase
VAAELNRPSQVVSAIELAKKIGWRGALEAVYAPDQLAYMTDPKRLKFLDLLPLSKHDTVALEIGCGLGQHTTEIANRVKRLDVLEVRLGNVLFTKLRCEQNAQKNVKFACGGDDCRIPYPDNSYNVVILNLVLEWCASGSAELSPQEGQQRLLSEIYRVLKPGGVVQINTKNRFSYRLIAGGRDEHCHNMRFGSALPRGLLRRLLPTTAPGHLHSYGGLRRLLLSAGLSPVSSYWALPEMRFAEHFIETDVSSIRTARRYLSQQGETRLSNLLLKMTPAWLVRYVTPGLFFIARK